MKRGGEGGSSRRRRGFVGWRDELIIIFILLINTFKYFYTFPKLKFPSVTAIFNFFSISSLDGYGGRVRTTEQVEDSGRASGFIVRSNCIQGREKMNKQEQKIRKRKTNQTVIVTRKGQPSGSAGTLLCPETNCIKSPRNSGVPASKIYLWLVSNQKKKKKKKTKQKKYLI